jgi:hypothetical protein
MRYVYRLRGAGQPDPAEDDYSGSHARRDVITCALMRSSRGEAVEVVRRSARNQFPIRGWHVYRTFNAHPAHDATEPARRALVAEINANPGERAALEAQHGQVWTTEELGRDFEVIGFMAPFVVVKRRSDGVKGSLEFQHHPRFYYSFHEDK